MIPWFTMFDFLHDWNKHICCLTYLLSFKFIKCIICICCPPKTKHNSIANLRKSSLMISGKKTEYSVLFRTVGILIYHVRLITLRVLRMHLFRCVHINALISATFILVQTLNKYYSRIKVELFS